MGLAVELLSDTVQAHFLGSYHSVLVGAFFAAFP
ncbi:MAG: hypothetical protein ACJAU4_000528 [Glaciecola sp.]|jgi:hypothetical protein